MENQLNCFALTTAGKCRALAIEYTKDCGVGCPFFKTEAMHKASCDRAETRCRQTGISYGNEYLREALLKSHN